MNRDTHVGHGYTLADLDQLARLAVERAHAQAMDYVDRYETAWHAIAETLCGEEPPTRRDLWVAGMQAIGRAVKAHNQFRGYNPETGTWRPAFERYWDVSRTVSPPDEQVVDRIALAQIWATLSPTHQEMLTAMAVHGDNVAAADAVGRPYATFNSHLRNARAAFRERWHEGETPSGFWGKGDRRSGARSGVQALRKRHQVRQRRQARLTEKTEQPNGV